MSQQENNQVVSQQDHGLKKHDIRVSTVVFMIFCLVAAGCYGIEEMIPECGPGLTIIMLCVLPFVWGLPFGLVASELGSVRPQEGGYYKWVQEALGEFWGFQAGWWRTISIYIDNTLYVHTGRRIRGVSVGRRRNRGIRHKSGHDNRIHLQ